MLFINIQLLFKVAFYVLRLLKSKFLGYSLYLTKLEGITLNVSIHFILVLIKTSI